MGAMELTSPRRAGVPIASQEPAAPKIILRGVGKSFSPAGIGTPVVALDKVDLDIGDREFVTLVGPSGCGKTTLLRLVAGLIRPSSGTVRVAGRTPQPGPDIGFVFQTFRLIPWQTVRNNITFALQAAGLARDERRERADRYLDLVGLRRFADAYPNQLSGGMKQRVALARALAVEPEILLMDEPFASIDAQTRAFMQMELLRIWRQRQSVVLFVTHSVDEAIILADRIVLMRPRPGRIEESLKVDLPRPRTQDVRSDPRFLELRRHLWNRIREMVTTDPESEFYQRAEIDSG